MLLECGYTPTCDSPPLTGRSAHAARLRSVVDLGRSWVCWHTFARSGDDASQQRVGRDQIGQALQPSATHRLAFGRQSPPLSIIKMKGFSQLLFEHTDFLFQVFNHGLLLA